MDGFRGNKMTDFNVGEIVYKIDVYKTEIEVNPYLVIAISAFIDNRRAQTCFDNMVRAIDDVLYTIYPISVNKVDDNTSHYWLSEEESEVKINSDYIFKSREKAIEHIEKNLNNIRNGNE